MLTLKEIESMEGALKAHVAYVAAIRREYEKTSRLDLLSDARKRAKEILDTAVTNQTRFTSRRNDLINQEPSDHEAVLDFVTQVRKLAGSTLPKLIDEERRASSTTRIVGGALVDTAKDVKLSFSIGLPLALVAVGLYFAITLGPKR